MSHYSYDIKERPANLGGGWNLKLYEEGVEMGGGVYPADSEGEAKAAYAYAKSFGDRWVRSHSTEAEEMPVAWLWTHPNGDRTVSLTPPSEDKYSANAIASGWEYHALVKQTSK